MDYEIRDSLTSEWMINAINLLSNVKFLLGADGNKTAVQINYAA